jgi:hypothetical protein
MNSNSYYVGERNKIRHQPLFSIRVEMRHTRTALKREVDVISKAHLESRHNMFEELYSDIDGLRREQTILKTTVLDLPMDDPMFDYTAPSRASSSFARTAVP